MPHFVIEYSANLDPLVDLPQLAVRLRDKAVETGVFPLPGVRVRFHRSDLYEIADGNPANAFMHIVLRIGAGRDLETRKRAGQEIFDFLTGHFDEMFSQRPFALSFEMVEIHADLNFKKNSIRDFLEKANS